MALSVFDASFYRAANSDLRGLSDAQALSHFQKYGLNEGRSFSPLIDLNFYRASNSDLANFSYRQAYEHLSTNGVREGRKISPFVDLDFYRRHNSDLGSFNNEQLFQHLQSYGVGEGRRFSPLVDLNFYRSVNSDLTSFNNNKALEHLETYGLSEGRRFSGFVDLNLYAAANLDLAKTGWNNLQLFEHLASYGVAEGRRFSVSFDSNYYRNAYSDLAQAGFSNTQLLEHFEDYGLSEGRASSESFNVKFYLDHNTDLQAAHFDNQQAEQHFEIYGFKEGRFSSPSEQISVSTSGDTTNSAPSLGILYGSRSIKVYVGSNPNNYYRFTIGNTSNFSLTSDGNADIQLLDGDGNSIATGLYDNTTSETINLSLNSGTYYIYLNSKSGVNTNYNLTVSDTPTPSSSQVFKSTDGYGLVDAGVAVARAIGQSAFANVPNLGGYNSGNDLTHVPEAWARGYTGKGITVAVLDSGVDYNHADLKDNIWTNPKEISGNGKDDDGDGYIDDVYGWNFVDNNNNVLDTNSHGTLVSGTIAGENNGFGVTGVAYDAKILPVKVLNNDGLGSYNSIADGIYYAVNHGANVINLSLGGDSGNDFLRYAIQYASSKGVIVVMAAGNESASTPDYPARYAKNWGIAVGAVDNNKNITDFSNYAGSDPIDYVTAPGVNVYSTSPGNNYTFYSGTSTATPFISGIVALMLSANPSLTPTQVRDILTSSAIHTT
ncbi:MAG: S8 family serine peptidase [Rhizonema sp. PD37]|nr:S8 family serine peptidase [Rhizonema sp. PD37]